MDWPAYPIGWAGAMIHLLWLKGGGVSVKRGRTLTLTFWLSVTGMSRPLSNVSRVLLTSSLVFSLVVVLLFPVVVGRSLFLSSPPHHHHCYPHRFIFFK